MAEKHEGDIPENNKNQKSFLKPDEPFKDWYDRVYGSKKKDEESKDTKKESEEQKEESKKEKEIVDKGSRQKDDIFRTFLNFISSSDQNRETLQYALGLLKEQYSKKEITKEQFEKLKTLTENKLSQSKKGDFSKEKKTEKKDFRKEKNKEESTQERKAQSKTPKDKGRQGPTYQEILQEIREAEGEKDSLKDNKEKDEAEKRLGELEKKREEYTLRARREGFFKDLEEITGGIREMTERGKYFSADLIRESRASITDPEGTPKELQGIRQDYYQREILKILREKSIPKDLEKQKEILREYLKVLRTGRLAPELITSNPLWIEMTSMIPYFKPELQEEFKARFEIFRYALGFKTADGVESGISGASRVLLSHIGKALKVPEIQKAYDLLEESSQITKEEIQITKEEIMKIVIKDNLSNKEAEEKLKKEKLKKVNPLYTGPREQTKAVLEYISLKLAKILGENTAGLSDEEKSELADKYMWAVEEADDVWRITFRSDESDIGMEGMGGQWYLNRLFHYAKRLERKGFGYESTRKYFNKPFFPEEIAPSKKGEARGLMMQGCWEYQINYLKIEGLEKLGFEREGGEEHIYYGEDGNGRELPYVIYKKEFKAPDGKSKEMEVRMSVDKKGKYTNVIEVANLSAEILSKICEKVPEGFYGSYVGDWIIKADNTKKLLEGGVLKIPPGSEENIERLLSDLRAKKLFDHLDPLSKDKERKPGKYYQEDAWEDLLRGAVDFGLHEGKHMFEQWKIWGAWRAGVLTKKATDLKVITNEQGTKIENEMLTFLGMRGNIPRLLRCNFDRFTMVYRWGPMRGMLLAEMIKQFFQGILPELPSAPRKK